MVSRQSRLHTALTTIRAEPTRLRLFGYLKYSIKEYNRDFAFYGVVEVEMNDSVIKQATACLEEVVKNAGEAGLPLESAIDQVIHTLGVKFSPEEIIDILDASRLVPSYEDPPIIFFDAQATVYA